MKYIIIALFPLFAFAGPWGDPGGGGAATSADTAGYADTSGFAAVAGSAVVAGTTYTLIDTLLPWDSIPGADDSALAAVRDTLNADLAESLALYLPLTNAIDSAIGAYVSAIKESVSALVKDSLSGYSPSAADSSFKTITGTNSDTLQIDSLVRAKAYYGNGAFLTGVSGTPDSSYKIITADSTATDAIGSKTGTTTIGGTGSTVAWGGIVSALKGLTIPAYSVAAGDTLYGRIFNSTTDSVIYIGGKKVDRSADSLLILIDLTP